MNILIQVTHETEYYETKKLLETTVHEGKKKKLKNAVAGDRTRVTRVTGGNTYHYTTTTQLIVCGK